MMMAMTLYTGENNDFFPPNPDDGNTVPGHNWCGGCRRGSGCHPCNPAHRLLVAFGGLSAGLSSCF